MVGMRVGLDQPFDRTAGGPDVIHDGVGGMKRDAAGRKVEIHHRIDDGTIGRGRVLDHVTDRTGLRIVEGFDFRYDAAVDRIGQREHGATFW